MKNILVVGDWVVDEHWVIGEHRSPTSSRIGHAHFRALHFPNSTVESLCGAGRTASVLHMAKIDDDPFCKVFGIGIWHERDTPELAEMLDPKKSSGKTLHQLTRPSAGDRRETGNEPIGDDERTGDDRGRLFNLARLLRARGSDHRFGTTRAIRIYQQTGDSFELLQRIDWELELPIRDSSNHIPTDDDEDEDNVWIREEDLSHDRELAAFLDRVSPIDAVVVKDMHKGVISKGLIGWLVKKCDGVPWFISTKVWEPAWFKELEGGRANVKLLMIPQMATQWAVRNGKLTRWITRSGDASKAALERMDELGKKFNDAIVVALPDGLSALARGRIEPGSQEERIGVIQTEKGPRPLAAGMPMASVFFAALAASLLDDDKCDLEERLKGSLQFTHRWMSFEVGRVEYHEGWKPSDHQLLVLKSRKPGSDITDEPKRPLVNLGSSDETSMIEKYPKPFDGNWKPIVWKKALEDWNKAFREYGIVEIKGDEYLELWRGMTEVNGYVSCIKSKRKTLQRAIIEMEDGKRRRHKSFMFIASPGSGKTFLVRKIAEELNLGFLGFNITQMLSKSDLLDCFDTIVTTQAQERERNWLVFFDEINGTIEGHHVYDAFLAPIEEGVYVRAGKTFHISPCIWVFAGTDDPSKTDEIEGNRDKSQKASDFKSRLTLDPLDLQIKGHHEAEARVEKVYLGVSLLRSTFPDVHKVSKNVLAAFHSLPPDLETRGVKRFVQSFVDIQYSAVRARNISEARFRELFKDAEEDTFAVDDLVSKWKRPEAEKMIVIRG